MSFGPDDSGILEFKTEEETKEYLENLGAKFKYGCRREGNPIQCHSLARWYASYKREYAKSEDVFRQNCFQHRFSDSCNGYAFYKVFGAPGVKRDADEAFQALKFGCHDCKVPKCCQGAGELLLEGAVAADEDDKVKDAMVFFTQGCNSGLSNSCFFLGGLRYRQAEDLRSGSSSTQGVSPEHESELRQSAVLAWVQACKLSGHELACRNAARAHRLGDGVDKDEAKAKEFLKTREKLEFN
ncbi:hypothetical protein Aperf_G00000079503 [Anoplocephala perfoliata]